MGWVDGWASVGWVDGWVWVGWVDGGSVWIGEGRLLSEVPEKNSGKNPPFKTGVLVVNPSKAFSGGTVSSGSSSSDSEMTGALGFRVSSLRGGIGGGSGGTVSSGSSSSDSEMTRALGIGGGSGGTVSSSHSLASIDILASGVPHWNKNLSHSLGVGCEDGFSLGL